MTVAQLIAALLLVVSTGTKPWYRDGKNPETPEQYEARSRMIVETIVQVTASAEGWEKWSHGDRAALLFGQTRQESGYWRHEVHSGQSRGDTGRAICLAQIHRKAGETKEAWESLAGTDTEATYRCLARAWSIFTQHKSLCGKTTAEPVLKSAAVLISAYGSGRSDCKPMTKFDWRAREWNRVKGELK